MTAQILNIYNLHKFKNFTVVQSILIQFLRMQICTEKLTVSMTDDTAIVSIAGIFLQLFTRENKSSPVPTKGFKNVPKDNWIFQREEFFPAFVYSISEKRKVAMIFFLLSGAVSIKINSGIFRASAHTHVEGAEEAVKLFDEEFPSYFIFRSLTLMLNNRTIN